MKILKTEYISEEMMKVLPPDDVSWIYNGLDCCVTSEVYGELTTQLEAEPQNVRDTYDFTLSKLAPIMEMSIRGMLIDEKARNTALLEMQAEYDTINARLQRIMREVFDFELNINSPTQVKNLFYGVMGLKPVRKRNSKGVFAPTVNDDALEKLQVYLWARPICKYIQTLRAIKKSMGFLRTDIDQDHRMRTSYNLAGTNTGRLSSRMSDFGTGTNVQNVDRALRYPFIADPGMYLLNIDLEQADGRNVGALCWEIFHDAPREYITRCLQEVKYLPEGKEWTGPIGPEFAGSYLDACESGDLHTTVCKMTWPDLGWPDDESEWKRFCDSVILHGQDSYRQGAKKLGHGTNYFGKPRTMAQHARAPVRLIENFQKSYFGAFPCIPAWHGHTIIQIRETGTITTPFGRRRMFWGRPDDSTFRKAIAYAPQSMTGEEIDRGLYQIWKAHKEVQLLNQVHDSILCQFPQDLLPHMPATILETMKVTLPLKGGRLFSVPLEAEGGWNWGKYDEKKNQQGLKKWKGEETRTRAVYLKRPRVSHLLR